MADLTQAMGLNPSSIYAAFGDKQALFSLAVRRYMDSRAQYATKALKEPTLKRVIRALFDNTVAFLTTPGHPPACMTLAGATGCSLDATPARDLMTEIRNQNEVAIQERLLKARKSGELPKRINVDDYTRYLSSILAGLSIQAANGSTKGELKRTAQMALRHGLLSLVAAAPAAFQLASATPTLPQCFPQPIPFSQNGEKNVLIFLSLLQKEAGRC